MFKKKIRFLVELRYGQRCNQFGIYILLIKQRFIQKIHNNYILNKNNRNNRFNKKKLENQSSDKNKIEGIED
jgi:hypothetical protein